MSRAQLTVLNPGAESAIGAEWVAVSNVLDRRSTYVLGKEGTYVFQVLNVGAFDFYQDIAIPSGEFTDIDASVRGVHFQFLASRYHLRQLTSSLTISLKALNGIGGVLQTWTRVIEHLEDLRYGAMWETVPTGTRTLRIGWSGNCAEAGDCWVDDLVLSLDELPNTSFTRRAAIVIDHTQAGGSDITDFEFRVWGTWPELATLNNGGYVFEWPTPMGADQRSSHGADIRFWSNAACTIPLDYEIEHVTRSDNPGFWAGGNFAAWVRIPTLSASVDTTIYITVGNKTRTVTTDFDPSAMWRSAHRAIFHFGGFGGSSGYGSPQGLDSSGNGNHLARQSPAGDGNAYALVWHVTPSLVVMGGRFMEVTSNSDPSRRSHNASLSLAGPFTIKCWFGIYGHANFRVLCVKGTASGTTRNYTIFSDAAGKVHLNFTQGGVFRVVTSTNSVPVSTTATDWHFLVATYDGSFLRLFIDNVLEASLAVTGAVDTNTNTFELGQLAPSSNRFDGALDHFKMLDIAEIAGRMTAEFNNQKPGQTFFTIGPWSAPLIRPKMRVRLVA